MIAFKFPLHFLHELLSKNLLVLTDNCNTKQGRIQGGARGAAPIIFGQDTELRPEGPKKNFFETGPPLSHGLDDLPPTHLTEGLGEPLLKRLVKTAN